MTSNKAETIPSSSSSGIRDNLVRHPLVSYFVMAYTFAWIAVLPLLLSRREVFEASLPVEPFMILGALAGPTISALIITAATGGGTAVRQFLRRYVQWRPGVQWYAVVLFGALVVLPLGASALLGPSVLQAQIRNIVQVITIFLPMLVVGIILGPL